MKPNQKCDCGECPRCKHRIYMRAYYQRPGVKEKWKERVARYQAKPETKALLPEKARRWEKRNPEKYRAQRKARYMVERGYWERQPCEVCGKKAEMHHDDYDKALEVRWLCRQHHKDQHKESYG